MIKSEIYGIMKQKKKRMLYDPKTRIWRNVAVFAMALLFLAIAAIGFMAKKGWRNAAVSDDAPGAETGKASDGEREKLNADMKKVNGMVRSTGAGVDPDKLNQDMKSAARDLKALN